MNVCTYDTRRYFLFWVQLFFGAWLLYVGLSKWFMFGPQNFVGMIASEFEKTWSPQFLNVALAWLILIAEPVLGLLLIIGKMPRLIWTLTALLMFQLVLGQTLLMKPDVISNWQYLLLAVICAALSDPEKCSMVRAGPS